MFGIPNIDPCIGEHGDLIFCSGGHWLGQKQHPSRLIPVAIGEKLTGLLAAQLHPKSALQFVNACFSRALGNQVDLAQRIFKRIPAAKIESIGMVHCVTLWGQAHPLPQQLIAQGRKVQPGIKPRQRVA